MKREYIKRVLEDWNNLKIEGIWLSGTEKEGEYKAWWSNTKLAIHCFYKKGLREGEFKQWSTHGDLYKHKLYKNGDEVKDYLA